MNLHLLGNFYLPCNCIPFHHKALSLSLIKLKYNQIVCSCLKGGGGGGQLMGFIKLITIRWHGRVLTKPTATDGWLGRWGGDALTPQVIPPSVKEMTSIPAPFTWESPQGTDEIIIYLAYE